MDDCCNNVGVFGAPAGSGGGGGGGTIPTSGAIYVSEAGSPTGSGSIEDPISDLQTAIDLVPAAPAIGIIRCLDGSAFILTEQLIVSGKFVFMYLPSSIVIASGLTGFATITNSQFLINCSFLQGIDGNATNLVTMITSVFLIDCLGLFSASNVVEAFNIDTLGIGGNPSLFVKVDSCGAALPLIKTTSDNQIQALGTIGFMESELFDPATTPGEAVTIKVNNAQYGGLVFQRALDPNEVTGPLFDDGGAALYKDVDRFGWKDELDNVYLLSNKIESSSSIFVDSSVSAGGSGLIDDPILDLQVAIDAATANDSIICLNGSNFTVSTKLTIDKGLKLFLPNSVISTTDNDFLEVTTAGEVSLVCRDIITNGVSNIAAIDLSVAGTFNLTCERYTWVSGLGIRRNPAGVVPCVLNIGSISGPNYFLESTMVATNQFTGSISDIGSTEFYNPAVSSSSLFVGKFGNKYLYSAYINLTTVATASVETPIDGVNLFVDVFDGKLKYRDDLGAITVIAIV